MCLTRYQANSEMDPPSAEFPLVDPVKIVQAILDELRRHRPEHELELNDVFSSQDYTPENGLKSIQLALGKKLSLQALESKFKTYGRLEKDLYDGLLIMSLAQK